jgi:hypothetical protein
MLLMHADIRSAGRTVARFLNGLASEPATVFPVAARGTQHRAAVLGAEQGTTAAAAPTTQAEGSRCRGHASSWESAAETVAFVEQIFSQGSSSMLSNMGR